MSTPDVGGEPDSVSSGTESTTAANQGHRGLGHRPGSSPVFTGSTVLRDHDAQCSNSRSGRHRAELAGRHTRSSVPSCPLRNIIISNDGVTAEEERKHDSCDDSKAHEWKEVGRKRKRHWRPSVSQKKHRMKSARSALIFGTRDIETLGGLSAEVVCHMACKSFSPCSHRRT